MVGIGHTTSSPARGDRTPPAVSVLEALAEVVVRHPDAVAIEAGDDAMTYAELDAATNRVAHHLLARGVRREERVAVAADRSLEAIVAFVGILKAGGAFVPIDADDPGARLEFILGDTGARVALTQARHVETMLAHAEEVIPLDTQLRSFAGDDPMRPPVDVAAADLAYVMYTSGSTGRPKGVAIEHGSIVQRVRGASEHMPEPGEGMLQVSALDFDAQTWEIWSALLNGARLVVAPPGRPDPRHIGRLLVERSVTVALLSPGLFHQMVEADPDDLRGLRRLLVGGDVMSPSHARRFIERFPACPLVNLYGPTEVTVCCTAQIVSGLAPHERVPIGTALGNSSLYVLNEHGRPVGAGERGELYIGGGCVARGYLNLPDATAERFLTDPFDGRAESRMYRTGDAVRLRSDGALDFLGRIDDQVKIRGYRIEPGEIEAALRGITGVANAAVVAREEVPGHARLVAYVVPAGPAAPSPDEVRTSLAERLPDHLMPSAVVAVDTLPLTARGKVDRDALPFPPRGRIRATRRRNRRPSGSGVSPTCGPTCSGSSTSESTTTSSRWAAIRCWRCASSCDCANTASTSRSMPCSKRARSGAWPGRPREPSDRPAARSSHPSRASVAARASR